MIVDNGADSRTGLLHSPFEFWAENTPDQIAVEQGAVRLTYRELDRQASAVAECLRRRGLGRDGIVALLCERSPRFLAAVLGILKAGGAYMPLDSQSPTERLAALVENARPLLTLCDRSLTGKAGATALPVVCLEDALGSRSAGFRASGVSARDLACVFYTSGSTGVPKGVCLEHRSLSNYAAAGAAMMDATSRDRMLQFAALTFDISAEEIWTTFAAGGTLVMKQEEMVSSFAALCQEATRAGVTIFDFPTAFWHELVLQLEKDRFPLPPDLRLVVIGGEAASGVRLDAWRKLAPGVRVLNTYGPTETTVVATCFDATHATSGSTGVLIGTSVAGARLYIVDSEGRQVTPGETGELWIGGPGVARCYLNRPEQTAAKFVSDPFRNTPGARVYKTGDRVRQREDGNLEFVERIDNQVKIRGFRVEPKEIENQLLRCEAVRDAAVVVRRAAGGEPSLMACVTPARAVSISELRIWLQEKLPAYMVPAGFVLLEKLPLTSSGKVDRRALEALEPESDSQCVRPRNEVEKKLLEIWKRHLKGNFGVTDNYWDLGGHSLMAVRVFTEIRTVFGKALSVSLLLTSPTIELIALRLNQEQEEENPLVIIQPGFDRPPLICIHAGGANVLFYRDLARRLGDDQPFWALQPKGVDGTSEPFRRVPDMAAYYLRAIRKMQPHGPYHLGGASFGGIVAFEMAHQLRAVGEDVALLAMFDTLGPGYPTPLPGVSRFRLFCYDWRARFRHHSETLAMLPAEEKFRYVCTKAIKAVKELQQQVRRRSGRALKHVAGAVHRLAGRELPAHLIRVQDAFSEAQDTYGFPRYPGTVVLFRAERQPDGIVPDPTLGWGPLVSDLRIIPSPGEHGTLLAEPRVGPTAAVLRRLLDNSIAARSAANRAAAG